MKNDVFSKFLHIFSLWISANHCCSWWCVPLSTKPEVICCMRKKTAHWYIKPLFHGKGLAYYICNWLQGISSTGTSISTNTSTSMLRERIYSPNSVRLVLRIASDEIFSFSYGWDSFGRVFWWWEFQKRPKLRFLTWRLWRLGRDSRVCRTSAAFGRRKKALLTRVCRESAAFGRRKKAPLTRVCRANVAFECTKKALATRVCWAIAAFGRRKKALATRVCRAIAAFECKKKALAIWVCWTNVAFECRKKALATWNCPWYSGEERVLNCGSKRIGEVRRG